MEKITVKHFVNKELKPQIENNKTKYPVYVQVIVLAKNLKFKSNNLYFEYLTEPDIEKEFVDSMLKTERDIIEGIVRELLDQDKKELITSKTLSLYTKNLSDVIDGNFKKLLLSEREETKKFIPSLFLSASYSEINEIIFFYNDSSPLDVISENIHTCLSAIHTVYDTITNDQFCVYDLFYGVKKQKIEELINYSNDFDKEETQKMITAIQELVTR